MASVFSRALRLIAVFFLSLVLFEACVSFFVANPRLSFGKFRQLLSMLNAEELMVPIQFDDRCSRYDPEVTYTLRPGSCVFRGAEFSDAYRINSLGVRDDEDSLQAPRIVVLGDSVTMGWGVAQEDAYPQVLERTLGIRVLNAGISSYGTARELMLLRRIDTSGMRTLIIQYSNNDDVENRSFLEGMPIPSMSESGFRDEARRRIEHCRYYPGKYSRFALRAFAGSCRRKIIPEAEDVHRREPAELFLGCLEKLGAGIPAEARVLVLADRKFSSSWSRVRERGEFSQWMPRVQVVVSDQVYVPQNRLLLDWHPNARGHREIASIVARELGSQSP
jgi:lysophospholipase L1-like esterase